MTPAAKAATQLRLLRPGFWWPGGYSLPQVIPPVQSPTRKDAATAPPRWRRFLF